MVQVLGTIQHPGGGLSIGVIYGSDSVFLGLFPYGTDRGQTGKNKKIGPGSLGLFSIRNHSDSDLLRIEEAKKIFWYKY